MASIVIFTKQTTITYHALVTISICNAVISSKQDLTDIQYILNIIFLEYVRV